MFERDVHRAGSPAQKDAPRPDEAVFDPEISAITADSRIVRPGALFFALAGNRTDGRRFVAEAVARGAAAIVTDEAAATTLGRAWGLPIIGCANPRRELALVAARFHGAQPSVVAAVTGTNGKTSTASFTRQIWQQAGKRAASLGTLGIETAQGLVAGGMTTPDPSTLHEVLAGLARDGIDHAVIEASSHGLDQYRLDGVRISAAAFTNLTQDHLDYHGTMEAYFAAKRRLFEDVLAPGGVAVLNADIPEYAALADAARANGHPILDYGTTGHALKLVSRTSDGEGQHLVVDVLGRHREIRLPLVGAFQAMNALAALGLALATGVDTDRAVAALGRLSGVPGRVEKVATLPNGAAIFVDYAHTPDGLEKILTALRPHVRGQLVCVFGAGGDRDPGKRPKMGATVAALADRAIVTDDNPRGEDPATIREQVLAACPGAREIGDRALAIQTAIEDLAPGDVLVVAGKGHEQGQTIAGIVHPFDDATVIRTGVTRLSTSASAGE